MTTDAELQREHERQQALLQALWQAAAPQALHAWLQAPDAAVTQRGLQAYRANGGAGAERALAGSFPTVHALLGAQSFAALARACWRACPPARGDLAWFCHSLPGFIEADGAPPELPYLADVARLDLLLAQAEAAPDAQPSPSSFDRMALHEPEQLRFVPAPGLALLESPYPVVTIWQAHHHAEDAQALFARASAALRAGEGEIALVWRQGWKAHALPLPEPATARWTDALLRGCTLADALRAGGAAFDFEPWLLQALQHGWVLGVEVL